ncbi:unnamed protein product [Alopecurus aequalis]
MDGSSRVRPRKKELFMSNIQQNSRACAYLHCAYIVRPLSCYQIVDPDQVIAYIADRLEIRKGMRIHLSTEEKIMLSFPSHAEALRAADLANQHELLNIEECPYQFFSGDQIAHIKTISVNQRVCITLRELPVHMWTSVIVEQVLAPYCALEYITPETRTMEDLSGFICIARSERTLEIPDKIAIKVPQDIEPGIPSEQSAATSLALYEYTVFVDKYEYLHGITRRYEYSSAPVVTTSHIVYPAQCYVLPKLLDKDAFQKYSAAVVMVVEPDCYFATLANLCTFLERNLHIRVRAKLLKTDTYLLYFDQPHHYISLSSLLSAHLDKWINRRKLQLLPWTPAYGSEHCEISRAVQLKIKGLPCNLNAPAIIEYIMGPFALVAVHHTVLRDTSSRLGGTVTIYECSAWCATYHAIPSTLQINLLPSWLTDLACLSSIGEHDCPVLDVSVLSRPLSLA